MRTAGLVLLVAGCASPRLGVVYEGREFGRTTSVERWTMECRDPVRSPDDCAKSGGHFPLIVLGVFWGAPSEIATATFRTAMDKRAKRIGCPLLVVRTNRSSLEGDRAIGGFCVQAPYVPKPALQTAGSVGPKPTFPPVAASVDAWSAAIEDYKPSVTPKSVKPTHLAELGTLTTPWTLYLAKVHVAVHPLFSDTFIEGLANLPVSDPMNNRQLVTRIEIVIDREGGIARMGVVKSSGLKKFDAGVLESVHRAAPFPKPPPEILSYDGRAYLQWELYRNDMRCSSVNAYPYIVVP